MSEILIACEMLRDELELASAQTGVSPATIWLDKGLHETPEVLRQTLQDQIDKLPASCSRILLAMSYCGGALDGIGSPSAAIAVPRFADCIRLLLSLSPGDSNLADCRSLYVTPQWMSSDRYLLRELEKYCRMYGEKRGEKIKHAMLANYRELRLIEIGGCDPAICEAAASDAAQLGLHFGRQAGTIRVLKKLLLHQFDDEFCIARPGETLSLQQFLQM